MKLTNLLLVCFSLSYSSLKAQSTNNTWLQHTDTAFNFTVQYPDNWQLKLPGTNTRFFITSYTENDADLFRENINCIARKMEQTNFVISSAEETIKSSLKEKMQNFELLKSGYVKWNNADALQLSYTCTQQSGSSTFKTHLFQQMAIVNGTLFTITFTSETNSYDKYIAVANKVIQSFKVNQE